MTELPAFEPLIALDPHQASDDFEYQVGQWIGRKRAELEGARRLQAEELEARGPLSGRLLSLEDVLALPDPQWLVDRFLPEGTTALIGLPNCGKSFVALHLAFCVASGHSWQGRQVKKGKVLYIAAEGASGLKKRLLALAAAHEDIWPADSLRFKTSAIELLSSPQVEQLVQLLDAEQHALVVVDTLSQSMPGANENDAKDMSRVVSALDKLKAVGSNVLVIHHTTKDDSKHLRGSSALEAGLEAAWHVKATDGLVTLTNSRQRNYEREPAMTLVPKTVGESLVFESLANLPLGAQQQVLERLPRSKEELASDALLESLGKRGSMSVAALEDSVVNERGLKKATVRRARSGLRQSGA
ncbi:MAG: DnaB domain protein helicase domain protein, partial [Chthonomonadaceae bacterium]|nr:DnaB domain protein helicase domain protein [Chthonomonadaceae bacterium]